MGSNPMKAPIDPFDLARQLAGCDKREADGVLGQMKKKVSPEKASAEIPICLNEREIQYLVRYCVVRTHQIEAQNNLGHGRKEELAMLRQLLRKLGEDGSDQV
jgi:hypothetical protein